MGFLPTRDLYVLQPTAVSQGANASVLRIVRVIKVGRSLKVARAAKLFSAIRILRDVPVWSGLVWSGSSVCFWRSGSTLQSGSYFVLV